MPMSSEKIIDRAVPGPIEHAKAKAENVQEELHVAGAELHLANTVLKKGLPEREKKGDVAKALAQHARVEEKVTHAAEELEQMTDLLDEAVSQRQRLEAELSKARTKRP
jgi:hypothetical protein